MDNKTEELLNIITTQITDNSYKVIEVKEILSNFNNTHNIDDKQLKSMMDFLQKYEYVDVKYSDTLVYCLAVKPKSRIYIENSQINLASKVSFNKIFLFYSILAGFCAFLGTALAIWVFMR